MVISPFMNMFFCNIVILCLISLTTAANIDGDTDKSRLLRYYQDFAKCSETVKRYKYRGEFQPMSVKRAKKLRIETEHCFNKAKTLDSTLDKFFSQTENKSIEELKFVSDSIPSALTSENHMGVTLTSMMTDIDVLNRFIESGGNQELLKTKPSFSKIAIVKPKPQKTVKTVKNTVTLEVAPSENQNSTQSATKHKREPKPRGNSHQKDSRVKNANG